MTAIGLIMNLFHVIQFKINRKHPKGRVIDIKMFGPRHTIPNAIPVLYLLNVYCMITFSFVNMSTYLRSVTDLPSKWGKSDRYKVYIHC